MDLVRGIRGVHGRYETAVYVMFGEMVGGRGLRGGEGKRVDGLFPGRPQSFRHQRRPVDDCSPGRGGMAPNSRTKGGRLHGEMDRCRESQGWITAYSSSICPNMMGRTKERIAQSKRARAGSLDIVDEPLVA